MKESEDVALRAAEMILLAECVFHEARGEPRKAREAVAHVVMNRVKDIRMRHDDRIYRTILRHEQFTPFNEPRKCGLSLGESWRRICHESKAWHDAMNTARMVIAEQIDDPTVGIGGANHFHDDRTNPPMWAEYIDDKQKMKIGRIWFYRI
jgi:spore germination cell wall hydrolase CwlJ-like protein